jgi:hypothetical protein
MCDMQLVSSHIQSNVGPICFVNNWDDIHILMQVHLVSFAYQ